MKSTLQRVDEFIEGLVEGDIESYLEQYKRQGAATGIPYSQTEELISDLHQDMFGYVTTADEANKMKIADRILNAIFIVRLNGVLKNNPNTVKGLVAERDFYQSRTVAAEARVKDLEDKLKDAYTAFDNSMKRFESMGQKSKGGEGR